ncbi:hypothetical protein GTN66_05275 [bacterium]|nr:hypothetical protein [bacterium]NIN92753.1 hypothetical protein [bacterium]NIO18734.1 hypothetical protein [bacterium]NIO73810.1 hypothetical protein [bacterium]
MRKIISILVLVLIFCSLPGKGLTYDKNDFGLGVILGSPTGLSAKLWLSKTTAFDAAAAWSFSRKGRFQIHGDYLWHKFNLIKVEEGSFPLYYGLGFRVNFGDEVEAGIRFPIGLEYIFPRAPFDVFIEVVPILRVIEKTDFEIDGAIGARFFFK